MVPEVLLIWIMVGQGLTVLVAGAGGCCSDISPSAYNFSFPSLWDGWMDDL